MFWGRFGQTHPSLEAPIARLSPLAQQVTGQRFLQLAVTSFHFRSVANLHMLGNFTSLTKFVPKSTSQHFSPKFNELHPDSAALGLWEARQPSLSPRPRSAPLPQSAQRCGPRCGRRYGPRCGRRRLSPRCR